ncbi:MAG: ABC transporter substrate-binding protein [Nocardioidaceae bacterium]|nr:MAG: ABC transporter substrate-binding protein [Nocardioidaceae bacterium]
MYDSLVDVPIDSVEPTPSLATDWKLGDDGLSLTLNLRDDVKFHSGRDFTSEDVAFSIKTWADPKWTVQFQRTAAAITDFDTTDPHTVVLKFDHKLSNVFDLLDVLPIIDSETFDGLGEGKAYVGTGPFTFESWTPQSELTFAKNADYWGNEPKLDGIEVHIVPDAQSLTSQLRTGQLDLAIGVSNRDVDTLVKTGDFTDTAYEGSERQYYVGTNVTNPALKDVRVRQAIAYALDRERIVADVFQGNGYPIVAPWPKYSPAYDEDINQKYSRDVDKGKALVEEVGNIPTLSLEYSTGSPTYEAIAQIVQANLADIGIKVDLVPNEHPTHIDRLINGKYTALWILDHAYAQWTPSTLAVTAYPFNADKNSSNFVDAKYKKDANAAWEVADGTSPEAVEAYRKVTEDLVENLFLIESNVTWIRIPVSTGVHDLAWTKRSELVLTDTWLDD